MLVIDGSYGEGGGQILRTTLSLAAILQRQVRIEHIRARRPQPGLRPQHLTAVRAMAAICGASLEGDRVGSCELVFRPGHAPRPGRYVFDVSQMAGAGSAGSVTLILQTVLLPLALADGPSHLVLRGGTHVEWSPPFHYLAHVYLPALAHMGVHAKVQLMHWGWYPQGGGEIVAKVVGGARLQPQEFIQRGPLRRLWGLSATSNLPTHIRQRQAEQARARLHDAGFSADIQQADAPSKGPGTCVFLCAEHERIAAGFTAYGRRGLPAERVADAAVDEFLAYQTARGATDAHLADQLVLPLALAGGALTTVRITSHLLTNIWVVEQFLGRRFTLEGVEAQEGLLRCLN
ncbi:MAG: RNA 3'-terminal phosphate cyclase [Anaerolineae bacterium]|nr:RNA 3'-terminal phosphate cyclase [Anaerolineae bacterium]MDW8101095.1 RNA 3'-terminal phosphate cyclase [Anaerolineae bacterium]